jgi:hypothetical protein
MGHYKSFQVGVCPMTIGEMAGCDSGNITGDVSEVYFWNRGSKKNRRTYSNTSLAKI